MMIVAARKFWSEKHLLTRLTFVSLVLVLLQPVGVVVRALPVASISGVSAVPLVFTQNVGQTAARVQFEARGLGGELFFNPQEVVLALPAAKVIHLQFEAANPAPLVEGLERLK